MNLIAAPVRDVSVDSQHLCGLTWSDNLLWFSDGELHVIRAVDPDTGQVVHEVACPGVRTGLTVWQDHLVQVVGADWRLRLIDPGTGQAVDELSNPRGGAELCGIEGSPSGLWLGFLELRLLDLREPPGLDLGHTVSVGGDIAGVTVTDRFLCYTDHGASSLTLIPRDGSGEVYPISVDANPTGLTWDGRNFWFCDHGRARLRAVQVPGVLGEL